MLGRGSSLFIFSPNSAHVKRPCVDETLLETTVQFQLLRRVFAATALACADRDGSYAAVGSIGPVVVSVGSAGRD